MLSALGGLSHLFLKTPITLGTVIILIMEIKSWKGSPDANAAMLFPSVFAFRPAWK